MPPVSTVSNRSLAYRPEIDGLRALAVLPVVFFHLGLSVFRGGFVGVDVFFVISGFLITSILVQAGPSFSVAQFFERRIRRILPAQLLNAVLVAAACGVLLFDLDLLRFGRSMLFQSIFAGNILPYLEDGYFAGPSATKPLLHYWSLAVEEQFYIFLALVLVLAWRSRAVRERPVFILRVLFAALAVLSLLAAAFAHSRNPAGVFFLAPFRAWELLAGSLLATVSQPPRDARVAAAGGWLGLLLLLVPVFWLSRDASFPFPHALWPCAGTALVIWALSGAKSSLAKRLLSSRLLVFFGKISFSLYLWHWPLIALARYWGGGELDAAEQIGIFAASVLISWASWRFVEQPFRAKAVVPTRKGAYAFGVAGLLLTALIGLTIRAGHGFPARFEPEVNAYRHASESWEPVQFECQTPRSTCTFGEGGRRILLWGDSHAQQVLPVLRDLALKSGAKLYYRGYCTPILGAEYRQCLAFNDETRELIAREKIDTVVLASRWSMYAMGFAADEPEETGTRWFRYRGKTARTQAEMGEIWRASFADSMTSLRATGARLFVMKEVPNHPFMVPIELAKRARLGEDASATGSPRTAYERKHGFVNETIDRVSRAAGASVLDPVPLLCNDGGLCFAAQGGRSLYKDDDHLSPAGAQFIAPLFAPVVAAPPPAK